MFDRFIHRSCGVLCIALISSKHSTHQQYQSNVFIYRVHNTFGENYEVFLIRIVKHVFMNRAIIEISIAQSRRLSVNYYLLRGVLASMTFTFFTLSTKSETDRPSLR